MIEVKWDKDGNLEKRVDFYVKEMDSRVRTNLKLWEYDFLKEIRNVIQEYRSGSLSRSTPYTPRKRKDGSLTEQLFDTQKYFHNWNSGNAPILSETEISAMVYTNTAYAKFLEEGTSKMEAFNTVHIAFERALPSLIELFRGGDK